MSLEQCFAEDADCFLCRVYETAWVVFGEIFSVVFQSQGVSLCHGFHPLCYSETIRHLLCFCVHVVVGVVRCRLVVSCDVISKQFGVQVL